MKRIFIIDSQEFEIEISDLNKDSVSFILGAKPFYFSLKSSHEHKTILSDNDNQSLQALAVCHFPSSLHSSMASITSIASIASIIQFENTTVRIGEKNLFVRKKSETSSDSAIISPMPGKILKVMVQQGDFISKAQPLIIVEAMKMEHTIRAGTKGVIDKLFCKEGDIVHAGFELLIIT